MIGSNGLGWKVSAEFGYIDTGGNTESSTVNARLNAVHESVTWRNKIAAEHLNTFNDIDTTAKRTVGELATNYKLDENDYLFANLRGEKDRFGGYDYRVSETVGYGHRYRWDRHRLDLEAGVGSSQTKVIGGERKSEPIVRLAGTYEWQISENAIFSETGFSEIGSENAHTESETALKLKVIGRLATKLSYRIIHNNEVPPGTEKTDTITAVTLVYDFDF